MAKILLNLVLAIILIVLVIASCSDKQEITMLVPGGTGLCEDMMAMSTVDLHNPVNNHYIFSYVGIQKNNIYYIETNAEGVPVVDIPVASSSEKFISTLESDGWLLSCPAKHIKPLVNCEGSSVWVLKGLVKAEDTQELWFFSQNMPREYCEQ